MTRHQPLTLLLAAYVSVGLFYSLATPPFEASDEVHHYPVVRHIATGNWLPVQQPGVTTAWAQEGSQPPAYYLFAAALTFWIDSSDFEQVHAINPFAKLGVPGTPQNSNYTRSPSIALASPFPPRGTFLAVYLLRFVSLLMGAGTVAFTYLLAQVLLPSPAQPGKWIPDAVPLLAASLVAFTPMFLFISASVNNDNLIWLESAAALFLFVHLVRGPSQRLPNEIGARPWHAPALGLLLGLAALTKLSGLALIPVGGLALLAQAVRTRDWRRLVVNGIIVAAVILLVAAWWYVRNLRLYGEPLGLEMMMNFLEARRQPLTLNTLIAEWRSFWFSYWGLFGAFSILSPGWVYGFFTVLCGASLIGLIVRAVQRRTSNAPETERWRVLAHGLTVLFIAATLISLLRWNLTSFAMQGRLTFTTLAPVATYMALGLLALIPQGVRRAAVAILVGILGLISVSVAGTTIAASYLPPAPITDSQLPASLHPVHALIAPGAELFGYTIDSSSPLKPGDSLTVTLYWRAVALMETDYNLFLHVLGRRRALVGSVDTWPGGGLRPTSFWKKDDIYPDTYVIQIDANAATPSALRLDVAMWGEDPARPLPITTVEGAPIPSVMVGVGALDSPHPIAVDPSHPADSALEGGIRLLGYDLDSRVVASQPTGLTLYWQTRGPIPVDFTTFVHIVDAAGVVVSQADGPPLDGDWPTSLWQPGFPVVDTRLITFPSAGEYRIRIGLYDSITGIRLPAFRADGSEWSDDAIDLGTVRVK